MPLVAVGEPEVGVVVVDVGGGGLGGGGLGGGGLGGGGLGVGVVHVGATNVVEVVTHKQSGRPVAGDDQS